MNEIWKDIPGYEGHYQASTFGSIRSVTKYVNSFQGLKKRMGKALALVITNNYKRVSLSKKGETKNISAHRLVGITFIPNPENKRTINHLNGIKTDNRVENLEWATYSENILHSFNTGLNMVGFHRRKLTFSDAEKIRKLYKNGNYSYNELGKKFGVTSNSIISIVLYKTYKF